MVVVWMRVTPYPAPISSQEASPTEEMGPTFGALGVFTAPVSYSVFPPKSYSESKTQEVDFSIHDGTLGQAFFNPYVVRAIDHF